MSDYSQETEKLGEAWGLFEMEVRLATAALIRAITEAFQGEEVVQPMKEPEQQKRENFLVEEGIERIPPRNTRPSVKRVVVKKWDPTYGVKKGR